MQVRPQFNPYLAGGEVDARLGTASLLRRVYGLLTASVLFSAIGAMVALYAGAAASHVVVAGRVVPPLVFMVAQHPWITLLVSVGAVMGASLVRQRPVVNVLALFAMATVLGVVIGPAIFFAQLSAALGGTISAAPVRDAFILALAAFGGLSAYALVSKRDFSFLSGALTMGLFVLLGASLLGFFWGGFHFHMAIASVAVLLFGGYVLYDTSRLLRLGERDPVGMTISLYLDFLNLFMALLRILGSRRDE